MEEHNNVQWFQVDYLLRDTWKVVGGRETPIKFRTLDSAMARARQASRNGTPVIVMLVTNSVTDDVATRLFQIIFKA